MRYLLIVLMFAVCASSGAQEIYRSVDKDGNVIFSDVPTKGAAKVQLKETTTIKSLKVESSPETGSVPEKTEIIPYKSIAITTPADDEAIRDNAGNVGVQVALEPSLLPGHEIIVYLDGKEQAQGTGASFSLQNIDRGTHQLRTSVKGPDGHILISSKSVTFHLLRHSVIKPKKTNAQ